MSQHSAQPQPSEWLHKCRSVLINLETKNIRTRALRWTEMVNSETLRLHSLLNLNTTSPIPPYSFTVTEPLKYLPFLSEWSGIKTRSAASSPATYLEFEAKAKNWLNGRRAPNYGNTLFPEMIRAAQRYCTQLGHLLFGAHSATATVYSKTLLFSLLHLLCSTRIAVHQSWKKTNLLCENSVKNSHSETAKLLQTLAIHDHHGDDLDSFPGNLQRASTFFQQQHAIYLQRLRAALAGPNEPPSHSAHSVAMSMERKETSLSQNEDPAQSLVAIKRRDYAAILERLSDLEQRHNAQAECISVLTRKCHQLQSKVERVTATDTSTECSIQHSQHSLMSQNTKPSPMALPGRYLHNMVHMDTRHAHPMASSQPMRPMQPPNYPLPLPLPFDLPPAMPSMGASANSMQTSPSRAASDSKLDMAAPAHNVANENTNSHSMPLLDSAMHTPMNMFAMDTQSMAPPNVGGGFVGGGFLDTATAFDVDLYHGHGQHTAHLSGPVHSNVMGDASMNYLTSSTPNYVEHALTVPDSHSQPQHAAAAPVSATMSVSMSGQPEPGPFGYSPMEYS